MAELTNEGDRYIAHQLAEKLASLLDAAREVVTDLQRLRPWMAEDGCPNPTEPEDHEGCWWCALGRSHDRLASVIASLEGEADE